MCIYIHPCLFLRKQREVTGVVHIGVGFLRCSFSVVGIAKALNMERTKVRFPRFFNIPFILHLSVYPVGVRGTLIGRLGMIHAGQLIERTLHEQGRTVPGSPDSYAVHVPIYTRYSRRKISTSIFFGAFRAYSIMISSAIYPITSVSVLLHVYPNKIHFCILSGTMISPAGILLSHTFAAY